MMIKSQSLNPNADDEASIVTYLIILGVLLTRYQAPFILLPSCRHCGSRVCELSATFLGSGRCRNHPFENAVYGRTENSGVMTYVSPFRTRTH
jgi:hypothetical protein